MCPGKHATPHAPQFCVLVLRFAQMPEQFRLSECLDRLPAGDDAARRLALLRVGQWFEGRADDPDVQPMGARFECGEFYGDDLLVTKRG